MLITLISIVFLLPVQANTTNSERDFGGIGIDGTPWANGQIVVRQIVTNGPAHQAGLKIGDIITNIDGKPTEGSNFHDMVERRLRGIAGTKVIIKVHRPSNGKNLTFNLTRRQLVIHKISRN